MDIFGKKKLFWSYVNKNIFADVRDHFSWLKTDWLLVNLDFQRPLDDMNMKIWIRLEFKRVSKLIYLFTITEF